MLLLVAGAVLAAILQLRFGVGHPTVMIVGGAGAASVSPTPATASAGQTGRFGISGSVTGLYPGASLPLVLAVSNPHQFTILVNSITTSVGSPSAGCLSTNLKVTAFVGSLSVAPKGTSNVTLVATLSHSAPDACQGVVFPLQYSGTATKP